jgi:3-oxoacyl-[acyl-carrier-protein] synthase III
MSETVWAPSGRGCAIRGWGGALPTASISNDDIGQILDTSDEWIVERSGIRERRLASGPLVGPVGAGGTVPTHLGVTGELAIRAGKEALESAHLDPHSVDMLILSTMTPDLQIPATSAMVAAELGVTGGAVDLNAACAGFVYGLVIAAGLISGGMNRVLLIGAETMSRAVNWTDRSTAFLFGDGAGAILLESVEGPGSLLGWDLGVDGSSVDLLYAEHGSGLVMKGQEVFRSAVKMAVESSTTAMKRAGITSSDVDVFVPHQANARLMESVRTKLGLNSHTLASIIESTGNTAAASIPMTLVDIVKQSRVKPGSLILFSGFGAGMSWASAVWRWDAVRS